MLSPDFAVPIMAGRMTPEQLQGLGVNARLLLYVSCTANAQRRTFYLTLREFAAWAGCSYTAARNAMDWMEGCGLVHEVERLGRDGVRGKLGEAFRDAGIDAAVVVRVYTRVFNLRPAQDDRRMMMDAVGSRPQDVKLWGMVCEMWKRDGYNPTNIGGLVDRFLKTKSGARTVLAGQVLPDYRPRDV